MKKVFLVLAGVVVVVAAGIFVFREQVFEATEPSVTENMFVSSDADNFDPGLPISAQFPAIRALYEGQEITGIDRFIRDKGAVFIAVRSVDW